MYFTGTDISCGVQEGSGIDYNTLEAEKSIVELLLNGYERCAIILFSDTIHRGKAKSNGQKLADLLRKRIKSHKIGELTASGIRTNPNSGNRIRVWSLAINWRRVPAWAKEVGVKKAERNAYGY